MENKDTTLNEKLYELISTKKFTELATDEKSLVLSQMPENEYNDLYEIHAESTKSFVSARPNTKIDTNIKKRLHSRMKAQSEEKRRSSNPVLALLNTKIPAYQLGFLMLLIGIIWFISRPANDGIIKTDTQIVYKSRVDTVFVEKPITALKAPTKTKTKQGTKTAKRKIETPLPTFQPSLTNFENNGTMENMVDPIKIAQVSHYGKSSYSIQDDSAIAHFLVKIY